MKETKSAVIRARATKEESAQIDRMATKLEIKRSEYIRRQCLGPIVKTNPQTAATIANLKTIVKELAPIGNNLNQITRHINTAVVSGQTLPGWVDSPETIPELAQLIHALQSELKTLLASEEGKLK